MQELYNQIQSLESQLTGNMFTDMEIKDKIHSHSNREKPHVY